MFKFDWSLIFSILLLGVLSFSPISISQAEEDINIPQINNELIENGLYTKDQMLEKLDLNSQREHPLIRLFANPEDFYEKRIITIGFFRVTTPKFGFLYVNKEEANIMNPYSRVGLGGYLEMDEMVDLKEFDYRYVIVSGTFSNHAGQLVIYNIDTVWDYIEMYENHHGEFSEGKFKNYLEKQPKK